MNVTYEGTKSFAQLYNILYCMHTILRHLRSFANSYDTPFWSNFKAASHVSFTEKANSEDIVMGSVQK